MIVCSPRCTSFPNALRSPQDRSDRPHTTVPLLVLVFGGMFSSSTMRACISRTQELELSNWVKNMMRPVEFVVPSCERFQTCVIVRLWVKLAHMAPYAKRLPNLRDWHLERSCHILLVLFHTKLRRCHGDEEACWILAGCLAPRGTHINIRLSKLLKMRMNLNTIQCSTHP